MQREYDTCEYTVECHYNANVLLNLNIKHPIAHPFGRRMGFFFLGSNSDLHSASVFQQCDGLDHSQCRRIYGDIFKISTVNSSLTQ